MPEEKKKTVDIDTSGPETEVEIAEEKDESVVDTAPKEEKETVAVSIVTPVISTGTAGLGVLLLIG